MRHTVIKLEDGLLQVSDTSMDELCTFTTCSTGEIVPLHAGDFESSAGSVQSGTGTGGTTAHDQQIKDVVSIILVFILAQDRAGLGASFGSPVDVDTGSSKMFKHLGTGGRRP